METDAFAGRMSEMRDSPWLASEDLENTHGDGYIEVVLTISSVLEIRDAEFKGGRKKKKGYAIAFQEIERMLYLNGVNRETLKEMFGKTAPEVVGNKITLYVNPHVRLGKEIKAGIRIKHYESPKLSAADQAYIEDAKKQIAESPSMEVLDAIGLALKEQAKPIQDAVRGAYKARKAELKGE